MQIQVVRRGAGVHAPQLRERVKRQLQRLSAWVAHVRLRFEDLNGPRGGVDKECQLQLQTRQGHLLRVTARDSAWEVAFATALDRLTQLLARHHTREAAVARRRPVALVSSDR